METQIESAARVFEEVEKIRRGCEAKLTHLARNRKCLSCGKDWMPKAYEPCPDCGSKNTRLMKQRRKCVDCGHRWQPSALGVCPWCGSAASEKNPKDDPYMREMAIPRLRTEEEFHETQMREMVQGHVAWVWASQAKGAGLTNVGRIIGKTDIYRVNTTSEFFAHCGFGLDLKCLSCGHIWSKSKSCPKCGSTETIGIPQRKRAGEKITYDAQLQSNCVMLGESLVKAGVRNRCVDCKTTYSRNTVKCVDCSRVYVRSEKVKSCPDCGSAKAISGKCPSCGSTKLEDYAISPYGQYYLDQKAKFSELPLRHAHNRAFRHMIKLFLSHFWQTWREAEGLPAPAPYAFAILKHPEGHLISPWDMVKKPDSAR